MSSSIPGLGYPGGRTGYASQANNKFFGAHSNNNALKNTFGGGVAGHPTPGMYKNNLGYPGGRTGYASQANNKFFGSGLGKAASANLVMTVGAVVVGSVLISHWGTRKKITGIGPIDDIVHGASKIVKPVSDTVKDVAKAVPVVGKPTVKGLEKVAKQTF